MNSIEYFENINIFDVCRACLQPCDDYNTLFDPFESSENQKLGDVLVDVVNIGMDINLETQPTRICIPCSKHLLSAYNFIEKTQKCNKRLMEYLAVKPTVSFDNQMIAQSHQIKVERDDSHDDNDIECDSEVIDPKTETTCYSVTFKEEDSETAKPEVSMACTAEEQQKETSSQRYRRKLKENPQLLADYRSRERARDAKRRELMRERMKADKELKELFRIKAKKRVQEARRRRRENQINNQTRVS